MYWLFAAQYLAVDNAGLFSLQDGNTPLHIAASMGHEKLTEMLLKAGSETTEKNNVSSFFVSGLSLKVNIGMQK